MYITIELLPMGSGKGGTPAVNILLILLVVARSPSLSKNAALNA
jgi:hypothetical protein